jgi:hypothetical protein
MNIEENMIENGDVKLYINSKNGSKNQIQDIKGILLTTNSKFFTRLWFQISNPFRYIFRGKIRY